MKLKNLQLYWTKHAKEKMRFYNLSENKIKKVLKFPHRVEEGIAPNTIAQMQKAGSKKRPYEIWVMYQIKKRQKRIITAWIYPGKSPKGKEIPIPEEIKRELKI